MSREQSVRMQTNRNVHSLSFNKPFHISNPVLSAVWFYSSWKIRPFLSTTCRFPIRLNMAASSLSRDALPFKYVPYRLLTKLSFHTCFFTARSVLAQTLHLSFVRERHVRNRKTCKSDDHLLFALVS
jgi:hypothetical protein